MARWTLADVYGIVGVWVDCIQVALIILYILVLREAWINMTSYLTIKEFVETKRLSLGRPSQEIHLALFDNIPPSI